jgi:hypothetical protein
LEGMHPTVAHVVPLKLSSMSAVEAPAPRATRSADNPAVPAPMIATSTTFMHRSIRNPCAQAMREGFDLNGPKWPNYPNWTHILILDKIAITGHRAQRPGSLT